MDRCYWIKLEDGLMAHIPHCISAAIGGPADCTCNVPYSEIEDAKRRRDIAEQVVESLRERLRRQADYCNGLFQRNHRLWHELQAARALEQEGRDG